MRRIVMLSEDRKAESLADEQKIDALALDRRRHRKGTRA